MAVFKLHIQSGTRKEALVKVINLLQPYYQVNSEFAMKVLALLVLESVDGEVQAVDRRILTTELGCTRQQLQNALKLLMQKKLITQLDTNHFQISSLVPGPSTQIVELTLESNDQV